MTNHVFFLDTETTSADTSKARVVQMAIIAESLFGDNRQYYECEWTVKPCVDIEIGAMATHHITEKMVQNKPSFAESEGCEVLKRRLLLDHILVAHNAPYDVAVLGNEGITIARSIDTLRVARHLEIEGAESYSLQYLRYFLSLDEKYGTSDSLGGYAHSALYDTKVLKWFYEYLQERILKLFPARDPAEKMLELTNTPMEVKTLKFGKYKGMKLQDIASKDRGYCEWLYREETKKPKHEQNEDLVYTLRRIVYT